MARPHHYDCCGVDWTDAKGSPLTNFIYVLGHDLEMNYPASLFSCSLLCFRGEFGNIACRSQH